jgi:hypothetical protein
MEFVEPEWDWFAVPSQGKFERVINKIIARSRIIVFFGGFGGGI